MPVDRSSEPSTASSVLSRRRALQLALGAASAATLAPAASASAATGAAAAKSPRTPKAFAGLDAMGTSLISDRVVPGLTIAAMRGGTLVYAQGFGLANVETNTLVTPDSVFRVGSVSKQFIATAIALLQEEGRLGFDDPLSKFLPLFPRAGDVTLRQMITHTSGLGNYTETQPREAFFKQARPDYSSAELLTAMANTSPLFKSDPGTAWAYSNTAYVLLGLVVEVVAGEPYAAFLRRRLFEPNGMKQTAVDDVNDIVPHRASGYSSKPGAPGAPGVWRNADFISMTYPGAAGAMRSTPSDLCRWHAALLGGRVVKPETLKTMLTPARLKNGELPDAPANPAEPDAPKKPMKYGFGLFFGEFEGHEFVEHGGGIFGFITGFRSFWPQQVTVATVVNYDGFASPADMKRIDELRDAAVRVAIASG